MKPPPRHFELGRTKKGEINTEESDFEIKVPTSSEFWVEKYSAGKNVLYDLLRVHNAQFEN